jgi:hypothetical protein
MAGCRRRVPASRAVGADAIHGPQLRRARPADAPFITALFIASRRAAMPWLPVLHDLEATVAFFRDVVPTRAEVWVEVGSGNVKPDAVRLSFEHWTCPIGIRTPEIQYREIVSQRVCCKQLRRSAQPTPGGDPQ